MQAYSIHKYTYPALMSTMIKRVSYMYIKIKLRICKKFCIKRNLSEPCICRTGTHIKFPIKSAKFSEDLSPFV